MKKILMSAAAFGVASFAFAEEAAVVTTNEVAVEQEHAAYEGFYFGIGVMARAAGEKVDYHGAGANSGDDYTESDSSPMCLGGTIVAGFGKKMKTNQAYVGIEAGLDFAPNTAHADVDKTTSDMQRLNPVAYNLHTKRNGLIPSVAVRVGIVDCHTKILTYAKAGISYAKSTEKYQQWDAGTTGALDTPISEFKISGITPILALGLEKSFAKKMTCRIEAEYKFGKNKSKTFTNPAALDVGSSKKFRQKDAITLRAMVCYNVKI